VQAALLVQFPYGRPQCRLSRGVRLASGEVHPREVVIVGLRFESRYELLDALGVEVIEHPLTDLTIDGAERVAGAR
jgi:hypothetical protein